MRHDVTYFAKTNFRHGNRVFGIQQHDRLSHLYIIGKTGTGKTTLLETFILDDIHSNRGVAALDPHGDWVAKIYRNVPHRRKKDVIYLDLTDPKQPYRYNPLTKVSPELAPLVVGGLLSVFENLFKHSWGDRLEHVLRFTLLVLLEQPNPSFKDILPMLQDKNFRTKALRNVTTKEVLDFWNKEFKKYQDFQLVPIYNKIGQFIAYPLVRRVLYENKVDLRLRTVMDEGKILLVNLSKGVIGEDASHLLGSLLVASLGLGAFSRANQPEDSRRPFHIIVDEFQNFTGSNLDTMLSELRKYKVSMTLAHQYTSQLSTDILDAVLGNVGSLISFRIGGKDAPYLAKEMFPYFQIDDFLKLPNRTIYLKLLIDGQPSEPFSATTLRFQDIPKHYMINQ